MRGTGGLLDRYVLRRFVAAYGLCLAGFVMLFLVMDFFAKLDDFLKAEKAIGRAGLEVWSIAAQYYVTKLPFITTMIAPYLTLFAGIATLITFGRHNEITPMVGAGRSHHRVLAPVYAFAVLVVFGFVAMEEYVVPPAAREHARLGAIVEGGEKGDAKRPPHLRDKATDNLFDARLWFSAQRRLVDVHTPLYRDGRAQALDGKFDAAELVYRINLATKEIGWFPRDGTVTPILGSGGGMLPDPTRLPPDRPIAFAMTPAEIDLACAAGGPGLTRQELVRLIALNPKKLELRMQLYTRSARPISSLVLLLLGLPFVTRPGQKTIGTGLSVALGTCVVYVGVDFFFQQLGNRGDLQPLVAAWFAPALFGWIALVRLDRVSG